MARDRETKTRSTAPDPHSIDLVEPLEDPALIGAWDPDPVIGHGQDDRAVARANGDPDLCRVVQLATIRDPG